MKTLTSDQLSSIGGETTTLARLLQITLLNGSVKYFTDCDIDLIVSGHTYLSSIGFDVSAIVQNVGTNKSTCTVDLLLSDSGISQAMIEGGVFDGASCVVSYIDWLHPSRGAIAVFAGTVAAVAYKDNRIATFDIEPLLSRNLPLTVEKFSSNCRADLGDVRCTIDIDALKTNFTVTDVVNFQQFKTGLTDADSHWNNGTIIFTAGSNNGLALEVGSYTLADGLITVRLLLPFTLQVGDTGYVYPGCDKTGHMCFTKFDNILNFRGELFIGDPTITSKTTTTTTPTTPATALRLVGAPA